MKIEELKALLKEMTIEEKVGQTIQLSADFFSDQSEDLTGPMNEMAMTEEKKYQVGSVLGISGAKETIQLQKRYMEKHRLHIPLLFMADIIHGDHTIFPIPLGLGATWNPDTVKKTAEISAKEAAAQGLHVTFSPMVDLVRDPRWGRVMEATGEDKLLNKRYARAFVEGYQGTDLKQDLTKLAACVKHFAGYGAPRGGRDYNSVDLNENTLREHYLPAYQEGIDAGAKLVMTAFNTIDNIPATGNKRLMRDILRDEMAFDGVLISDWGAIGELVPHGVAEDNKAAAIQALTVGVDIEMMSAAYSEHLIDLVEQDETLKELLDESVWNILRLKNDLGLFENPFRGADEETESLSVFSDENKKAALTTAEESIVLLENNGVLPLNQEEKIVLTGPLKDSNDILGAWSWKGDREQAATLAEMMGQRLGPDSLSIVDESQFFEGQNSFFMNEIHLSDTVIVALGESSEMSGEAASRTIISLPEYQMVLLRELKKLNKKVVAVLFNGRPLDLSGVVPLVDGLVEAWFPGTMGAEAVTNVLFGKFNPSGKLPMSFPRSVGQVPLAYNEDSTGRPMTDEKRNEKYLSRYLDSENTALYPFGFGRSYTSFDYSECTLSSQEISMETSLTISIEIKNTGKIKGIETVQVYVRDKVGEVVRPVKELIDFKKVELEAGESMTVEFEITEKQLRYTHADHSVRSDAGEFSIGIGTDSSAELTHSFYLEK
ncbi:glycoside hydrolase family 3 N-terminal domain-containing protein [Marinilactibacillus sp. Marseille-P9653]|uniref:glycoside hydrolase family 3 N-terminal domain-containing protein n=1 Tax=Marinilactibacillus sp. Marseille-P9653 TaxID=2866583 RepID=UPI001CE3FF6D|nr:glycoside hydrolase family 3 N-terminal domain-containing protein [Marinilactibacillus sp. Marseille-P9653]